MSSSLSSNSSDHFNLGAAFGASKKSDTQKRPLSSTSSTIAWNPEDLENTSNYDRLDQREETIIPVSEVLYRDATMNKGAFAVDAEDLPIAKFSLNYPEVFEKWRPIWEILNTKGWHYIIHAGRLYCTSANVTHLIVLNRNHDFNVEDLSTESEENEMDTESEAESTECDLLFAAIKEASKDDGEIIGEGIFGMVSKCTIGYDSYAIKQISLNGIERIMPANTVLQRETLLEVHARRKLIQQDWLRALLRRSKISIKEWKMLTFACFAWTVCSGGKPNSFGFFCGWETLETPLRALVHNKISEKLQAELHNLGISLDDRDQMRRLEIIIHAIADETRYVFAGELGFDHQAMNAFYERIDAYFSFQSNSQENILQRIILALWNVNFSVELKLFELINGEHELLPASLQVMNFPIIQWIEIPIDYTGEAWIKLLSKFYPYTLQNFLNEQHIPC